MFEQLSGAKYEAMTTLISNVFVYHPGVDIYLPRYGAIDGKVMRYFLDAASGSSLARRGVGDTEFLVALE